jgi:signal transduction histidine kinase
LTNVLRHANASSARVAVRTTAKSLEIEITDDGPSGDLDVSPGLGLRGMTERATALGGRINAGRSASSGWCVHAVLPLNGSEPR